MAESRGNERRGYELRVFVQYRNPPTSDEQQKMLLSLRRSADGRETDITLPEADGIVDTGWIPEIVQKQEQTDIIIRPDMERFQRMDGGAAASGRVVTDSNETQGGTGQVAAEGHWAAGAQEVSGRKAVPRGQRTAETERFPSIGETGDGHSGCDEVLYRVTFVSREVRVNGFRLSKPNFTSENELVFDYIFHNPNRNIGIQEIEEAIGRPLTKKLREIVRDLGFVRELRELFFPDISKTCIRFVNPVTQAEFERRGPRAPGIKVV